MQEACSPHNSNVAFIACSPLAGGALSGKYLDLKNAPLDARMRAYPGWMTRYLHPPCQAATAKYAAIAKELDIPMAALSLAWVYAHAVTKECGSTLLGVTNVAQLSEDIHCLHLSKQLQGSILEEFDAIYAEHRDPARSSHPVYDPSIEQMDLTKIPWGLRGETEMPSSLQKLFDDLMEKEKKDALENAWLNNPGVRAADVKDIMGEAKDDFFGASL